MDMQSQELASDMLCHFKGNMAAKPERVVLKSWEKKQCRRSFDNATGLHFR